MVQAQIQGCSVILLGPLACKAGAENTAPRFLTWTSAKVSSSLNASKSLNASSQASEKTVLLKKLLKSDFFLTQY